MNDALGMGRVQDGGDLYRDVQLGAEIQVLIGFPQSLTFDEFKDQEVAAVDFQVIEDAADTRVIELGQKLGFPQETGFGGGGQAPAGGDGLDRHLALEVFIVGGVYVAHAALTQGRNDIEMAELTANQGHVSPG